MSSAEKKQLTAADVKKIVDLAVEAGAVLLKNGSEIFRAQETIEHICYGYHVKKMDVFVLTHAIFLTAEADDGETVSRVKNVPLSGANLEKVAEVNELSREIAGGKISIEDAYHRLKWIEHLPPMKGWIQVIGSGFTSGCFGFLLNASTPECIAAMFIGALVHAWVLFAGKHRVSKILVNIAGGMLITMAAIFAIYMADVPMKLSGIVTGAIMPLIPGVAFTNAIRDIADSDFLSGTVRMIDALLVFVYIAVGVGLVLGVYNNMVGGLSL